MADKRIIELTNEKLSLSDGDFTMVDSEDGTYKYDLSRIIEAIPAIDSTLTQEGEAADAKAVRDLVGSIDIDTVDNSRQLLSENYVLDEEPYFFRASGGDGADRVEECIVGGSVAWNQLVQNGNFENDSTNRWYIDASRGALSAENNVLTITSTGAGFTSPIANIADVTGHKVLVRFGIKESDNTKKILASLSSQSINTNKFLSNYTPASADTWYDLAFVYLPTDSSATMLRIGVDSMSDGDTFSLRRVNIIDLTTMFGSTIADHIYSLEQSTAGAGVAWLRKYFPEDYYPYSAPTLKHVEGVSQKEVVGFNLFDKSRATANSAINSSGEVVSGSLCVSDFIQVMPNTTYYFKDLETKANARPLVYYDGNKNFVEIASWSASSTTHHISDSRTIPDGVHYVRIIAHPDYVDEACVSLSSDRDGQYEPYHKNIYPLDSTWVGMGIPKLANGKLYFDGDIYPPSGQTRNRYALVDLGTLDWSKTTIGSSDVFTTTLSNAKPVTSNTVVFNGIAESFVVISRATMNGALNQNCIALNTLATLLAYSTTTYTDAATFKTAMSGQHLVYELATPTTETADPYTAIQLLDPHGTEEFVSTGIVPVGHESHYLENLRSKIEGLPRDFSTLIAPTEETYKATQNYTVGKLLIVNNILYKVTANIANGATITPNTNVTAKPLSEIIAELA